MPRPQHRSQLIRLALRHDFLPRPDDPWAITATPDPAYKDAWYPDGPYVRSTEDPDDLKAIQRGMEVD